MPFGLRKFLYSAGFFLVMALPARAAVVNATWNAAADVPVTASSYTATGSTVNFALNYAPATGTSLMVVNNTSTGFVSGAFSNLAQGQAVTLVYNGVKYNYVANYYGGTGNDLVLVWASNRVLAWGYNNLGQIGDSTSSNNRLVPAAVTASGVLAGKTIIALAAGSFHSLALCSDGTLAAWGYNTDGQLGDNTTTQRNAPVAVNTASGVSALYGKTVVAIAAGNNTSLALCSDGTVAAWGLNTYGGLGDNSTISRSVPVAVNTTSGVSALYGKVVTSIAAGWFHNLAVCSDGTVVAWGYNTSGQLGINNTTPIQSVPVLVNTASGTSALFGKTVVAVGAGYAHSLALCSDGTVAAWGRNTEGQLGDTTTTQRLVPVTVNTASGTSALYGKTVVAVGTGYSHCMALCSDGTLAAWGYNAYGQLGDDTTTQRNAPVLVNATNNLSALYGKTVQGIVLGYSHSAALCTDGTIASWGHNLLGTLGNNSTTSSSLPVSASTSTLVTGEKFNQAGSGSQAYHTLALAVSPPPAPTAATLAGSSVTATGATLNGTANANNNTTAVSFEYGLTTAYGSTVAATPGTLTDSTGTAESATVSGLTPATLYHYRIKAASGAGIAYGSDQTFTTLSSNASLAGLGLSSGTLSPGFDSGTTSYAATVANVISVLAVTPTVADATATVTVNGSSVASGSGTSIPLSIGSNTIITVVTAQDGGTTQTYTLTVTRVSTPLAASYTTGSEVPLTTNGLTLTGGTVNFTLNDAPAPGTNLTVVNNTGLSFINGTFDNLAQGQAVILSYNGIAYNYVANYYGGTGNDLVLVWASNRVLAWGGNFYGQLGDNTIDRRLVPIAVTASGVLAGKTILALATGSSHSLALCSDGTLAAWGDNSFGELGDNSTTPHGTPVLVNTAAGVSVLYGKTVVAIAAGLHSSLALCSDGTVAAWGYNFYGQVGDNSNTDRRVPVAVNTASGVSALYGKTVIAIVVGSIHSLALCADGTLVAWGSNASGQLGNNSSSTKSVPVLVNTASGTSALFGKTVVTLGAGDVHSLALCSDGTLAAWGNNTYGELGDTTTTRRLVPVAVNTASGVSALYGRSIVALSAGQHHSSALCSDGTVTAWGYNVYGQLGDNTTTQRNAPVLVNATTNLSALYGKTVQGITFGYSHSAALCTDGTIATWGDNSLGSLGNNSTISSSLPVSVSTSMLVPGEKFVKACSTSSGLHMLGLVAAPPAAPTVATLAASSVSATGAALNGTANANNSTTTVSFEYGLTTAYGSTVAATPGRLTDSNSTEESATVSGLTPATLYHYRIKAVSGAGTSYGVDAAFTTLNYDANLSDLTTSSGTLTPAFTISGNNYATAVSTDTTSITVTPTASDSNATLKVNGTPVTSGSASSPISLSYGENTITVLITATDTVTTWTYTLTVTRPTPPTWPIAFASASDVPMTANGYSASGAVDFSLNYAPAPGTTLTVVNNTSLGFISGTFSNLAQGQIVPLIYDGVTYKFVANYYGGTGNDLVLTWAGTRLVGWGDNRDYQVGSNGSNLLLGTPLASQIPMTVAAGNGYSLALFTDGTLASWGVNLGPTGLSTTYSTEPTLLPTAGTLLTGRVVVAVTAGGYHALALCSDGTLASWGDNSKGQLGNSTSGYSQVPVAVTTAGTPLASKSVVVISAGLIHSLALCSDGTLMAWGSNSNSQLGNPTVNDVTFTPVAVSTAGTPLAGKTVVSVSAGGFHSLALCSDGTLVGWGQNASGQLGNNSTTTSSVPVAVTTVGTPLEGKTVIAISAGLDHSLALCSDGTLAAWGGNWSGALGNATLTASSVPVAVSTNGVLAGKTVIGVTAGEYYSLAWCSDGTAVAWGRNDFGQLGNSSAGYSISVPVLVNSPAPAAGERFKQVASSSSSQHALGLVATASPDGTSFNGAASLSGLAVSTGTLNTPFASDTFFYLVVLDSTVTSIAITPTASASHASISVNGQVAASGAASGAITLVAGVGGNLIPVTVTAENGTQAQYSVFVACLSKVEQWRLQAFGAPFDSDPAADTADADNDGICNLLEFALNLSPATASKLPVSSAINGGNYEYTYTRSTAAANAGTKFTVEWNATLSATWSSSGVTQTVLSDDGTTQQVKAVIPMNAASRMFVHLSVTAPP